MGENHKSDRMISILSNYDRVKTKLAEKVSSMMNRDSFDVNQEPQDLIKKTSK